MAVDHPTLSRQATFHVPQPDDAPSSFLDRWSNTYLSLPAALAVPHTEADITALVSYAKQKRLSVVTSAGKHLASVPVTPNTLYVDMKNFDAINIDEEARTVTIGGGLTTGPVLQALSAAGYYTGVPNTNSVGIVGAFLGGGSSPLNSVSGLMVDHAVSARLVTAGGKTLNLGPGSQGEEASLWSALRGAGHGLGVVTELKLRIHPISDLKLDDNKFWSRTLMFPGPAVPLAAATFAKLLPVQGPISLKILLMRSPPGTPSPGAPIAVLAADYFGPSAEAEKALALLLDAEVTGATVRATTTLLPMSSMNDATKMTETRGGLKRSEGTLLKEPVTASTIQRSFERFLQLGEDASDAKFGAVVYYAFDSRVLSSAPAGGFFEPRETSTIVYHDIWFNEEASAELVDAYLPEGIMIARSSERGPLRRFANFFRHPAVLAETYSEEKVVEKKRVKEVWDPENVFWTPGL